MIFAQTRVLWLAILSLLGSLAQAAPFGTVVPIGGHASDLALDRTRGLLFIANFTGNRIDSISLEDHRLRTPIRITPQPDAIAVSPDGRYLVVAHYANFSAPFTNTSGLTILDLTTNVRRTVPLPVDSAGSALTVAFGNSPRALLVTTRSFQLLDPATGALEALSVLQNQGAFSTSKLPVNWATFPPQILRASSTISGDGNTIVILAELSEAEVIARYQIPQNRLVADAVVAAPRLGPRVVSTDTLGRRVMAGWGLIDESFVLEAQLPRPNGLYQTGSHAMDDRSNTIYAHVPAGSAQTAPGTPVLPGTPAQPTVAESPVLHIMDADNLTVRERLQLRENLAGKSVWSPDRRTIYSISDSGVTVLPVGSLDRAPILATSEEDILFEGNACDRRSIVRQILIADRNGGSVDFQLELPSGARGIRLSQTSGTTPAQVRVEVDPSAFQANRGTSIVPLQVHSSGALNLVPPVRLLINTRDLDQRGSPINVPGTIVDVLADPVRDRLYVLRQDKNLVLVFDGSTFRQIGSLRTGNTPIQMAMTGDNRHLMVTADNSQIIHVYDLETLLPSQRIVLPGGLYGRSIAVSRGAIWATTRAAGRTDLGCPTDPGGGSTAPPSGTGGTTPPAETAQEHRLVRIDFETRRGTPPCWLGIFRNSISENSVITASPSGRFTFLSMPDGTVALYDSDYDAFAASRKDISGLTGAYTAVSDDVFAVGTHLLNQSLVPMQQLDGEGTVSGMIVADGSIIRMSSSSATGPGRIERLEGERFSIIGPTRTVESPLTPAMMRTAPVGQIGQTILPFTRTLAALSNGQRLAALTASGLTIFPRDFAAVFPAPEISGIRNSADGSEFVAPGGLVTIAGSSFTNLSERADSLPLPRALAGVCATVNNIAVPLLQVGPNEIEGQLPFESTSAQSTLVVRNAGGISNPFTFPVLPSAPAVFRSGTAGDQSGLPLIIRSANEELVTLSNPVRPGDTLTIFATGLGRTVPEVESGVGSPSDPLAQAAAIPSVSIGGTRLPVDFAGLSPGLVGVYAIVVSVPDTVPEGMEMPLVISQGTYSTTMAVRVVKP